MLLLENGSITELHIPNRNHRKVEPPETLSDLFECGAHRYLLFVLSVQYRSITGVSCKKYFHTTVVADLFDDPACPECLESVEYRPPGEVLGRRTRDVNGDGVDCVVRCRHLNTFRVPPVHDVDVALWDAERAKVGPVSERRKEVGSAGTPGQFLDCVRVEAVI